MKNIRKIFAPLSLCLALVTAVCMCGCSDKGEEKETQKTEQTVNISAGELLEKMVKTQESFPEYSTLLSQEAGDEDIKAAAWESLYEDFDIDKVEDFAVSYSTEATADEITVVVLKNSEDAEALKDAMKIRVGQRITTFETYGPDEVSKLKDMKIVSQGKCVALIVCDDPDAAAQVFKEATNE